MSELRPVDLVVVPYEHLETIFPLAEPWLKRACEQNAEWDVAELKAGVRERRFQLWMIWDKGKKECLGAGVTRLSTNKLGDKIGHDVVFAGADVEHQLPFLDRVEEFFRLNGCTKMRITGRKGWARKLKHYRLAAVVLEKALR